MLKEYHQVVRRLTSYKRSSLFEIKLSAKTLQTLFWQLKKNKYAAPPSGFPNFNVNNFYTDPRFKSSCK